MSISDTASPFVSILIVTRHRADWLRQCIESIESAELPWPLEIIVMVNGDCAETVAWLRIRPSISWRCCIQTTPAGARNRALPLTTGKFVCFLDDDVCVPQKYFRVFQDLLAVYPEVEIAGGPDATFTDASYIEYAIGLALMSPLSTAHTRWRHSGGRGTGVRVADEGSLILCNLWMRRDLIPRESRLFDERFRRGEENVLLNQHRGRVMLHDPTLFVYHRRKTNFSAFFRAVFFSGFFRAQSFCLYPTSIRAVYFVPTLFTAYCATKYLIRWPFAYGPIGLYVCLNLGASLVLGCRGRRWWLFPVVSFYQASITLGYGLGFAAGMLRTLISKAHQGKRMATDQEEW